MVQMKNGFMPKIAKFDKNEALAKALQLFWEKGYQGTSLSNLTNTLGIGKGSFYNSFKNKQAIFDECLELYSDLSVEEMKNCISSHDNAADGIKHFLLLYADISNEKSFHKGCLITNIGSELQSDQLEIREKINIHYQSIIEILTTYLNTHTNWGLKKSNLQSEVILTFYIGLTVQFKLKTKKDEIIDTVDNFILSLF